MIAGKFQVNAFWSFRVNNVRLFENQTHPREAGCLCSRWLRRLGPTGSCLSACVNALQRIARWNQQKVTSDQAVRSDSYGLIPPVVARRCWAEKLS